MKKKYVLEYCYTVDPLRWGTLPCLQQQILRIEKARKQKTSWNKMEKTQRVDFQRNWDDHTATVTSTDHREKTQKGRK